MLKEINCDRFSKQTLTFSNGINTILGDDVSTNSIGKSSLLNIIDFVFGGKTYVEKGSSTIKQLGNHSFNFEFIFNDVSYYYNRSTEDCSKITICDREYNPVSELNIKDYLLRLKKFYKIENSSSFRETVSPYSRFWPKDNYDADHPLRSHVKQKQADEVANLVKLFRQYSEIEETKKKIKHESESKTILRGIDKFNYVKGINKKEFESNTNRIIEIKSELQNIEDNILQITLNAEELINNDVLELRVDKKKLLDSNSLLLNKIKRLELNIEKRKTKKKYFSRLSEFFKDVNTDKISEIEMFHDKISGILAREIISSKKQLEKEREKYNQQIAEVDDKIDYLLGDIDSPRYIVNKVYDLTIEKSKLERENKLYDKQRSTASKIKVLNDKLDEEFSNILSEIEMKINKELIAFNNFIYSEIKEVPKIRLKKSSYTYDHGSNTGTGKSYVDLIEFDLSILELTNLPFVIHDSICFKNVEDRAIDQIINLYANFEKQIFISLDGIKKYEKRTQNILNSNSVIHLSKSNTLFHKRWE